MKKIIVFSLVCLCIFIFITGYRVHADGMNSSIHDGDLVWIWPLEPQEGDVVLLRNPLQKNGERILRRVIATEGRISYDRNGTIVKEGKRIAQLDMGTTQTHRIIEERIDTQNGMVKKWRIQRFIEPILLDIEDVDIPKEHMYVLADRRDEELDSRYWGAIPLSSVEGVVVFRLGMPDTWNHWYTIFP